MRPVRTLVVDCPDWAITAAGFTLDEPAAVFVANRATVTSPAARAEGVANGMRRREAQARCPALVVLAPDPARDARSFEPVLGAMEALTPRIELTVPGRCAFGTLGPARYFGGDEALARRALALADDALCGRRPISVGVADGPFAAALAAALGAGNTGASGGGGLLVVPEGGASAFLAGCQLEVLERPELVEVLRRLGLHTLGELAALPATDVLARFGPQGATAHRLASGLDPRPLATRSPQPELAVQSELDPPAERVEPAAFVARALAEQLTGRLHARGEACTRVLVIAETEHGERNERLWRMEGAGTAGALGPAAIAERVRWQLDGWLSGAKRPTAGITLLRLEPDEVVAAKGRQLGFWGSAGVADERVMRALARLEGLLGPESVTVPEWRGGRLPGELVAAVPAGAVDLSAARPAAKPAASTSSGVPLPGERPWPGALPSPSPATVPAEPTEIEVLDANGAPVGVDGRGTLSATPERLRAGRNERRVAAWAGPWPVEERWWDPVTHRRRARFQVLTDDGVARLVVLENGRWSIAAVYD
ncbi:MAG: DNA polymerase Y family protein [Acidimicrobiales bacterium]